MGQNKSRALELFAGAGGLALGLEQSGINTVGLIEINKDACDTLTRNRPHWNVLQKDVKDTDYRIFANYEIDILSGGFPCQAFSYAGKGLGFDDHRGNLVFEMIRCLSELKPKLLIAENVAGLKSHNGGKTLQTILDLLKGIGYSPKCQLLNAVMFGVPQKRKRLLITATREVDHPDCVIEPLNESPVTINEALKDCPHSKGATYSKTKKSVLDLVPEGGCWVDLPDEVQKKYMGAAYGTGSDLGGRRGMARRMSWHEPSLTILCSPSQKQIERCHPSQTRPFTVRESARLQTFPDDWHFSGSLYSQYRQIGNAVPVKLGYYIGQYADFLLKKAF